jgi:choline dehydrogenase-like flavoprotein
MSSEWRNGRGPQHLGAPGVHDLVLFPAAGPDYDISSAVFAMKPRSRGRVSLTSPLPQAPLEIDHGFLSEEADVEVLVEGFEQLREIGAALSGYAGRELRPGEEVCRRTRASDSARLLPPSRNVRDRRGR